MGGMRVPETLDEVQRRIEDNIVYFQMNYLLIAFVFIVIILLTHPARLLVAAATVTMWAVYARRGGMDPEWIPVVNGIELTQAHRLVLLIGTSLAMLFVVAGEALIML